MGFGVTIITFSPNTHIKAADVNSNFTALNNATTYTGPLTTLSSDGAALTSDGSGNLLCKGRFGLATQGDTLDWTNPNGSLRIATATNPQGKISLQVDAGTPVAPTTVVDITNKGIQLYLGTFKLNTGSIARSSTFDGNTDGTYNHGNGGTPTIVMPTMNQTTIDDAGYGTVGPTQVYIVCEGTSFRAWCIGF